MLESILAWSIRRRAVVLLLALGLVVVGVLSFRALPIDAFPDTTPVQVQINTAAPALGPLEIERQISAPIEQAISGLPGLVEVRSVSRFGFSQVTVIFDEETDIYLGRQVVSERLGTVQLPPGIERPSLGPVATGLGEVFHYVVRGDGRSLAEVRAAHDWIIAPQMRSVPGVAEVNSWGGDERQIQIVVDPIALQARGLTLHDIVEAVERDGRNVGGGTMYDAGGSFLVLGSALLTEPEQVGDIVVGAERGVPIRVKDVAQVVEGREIRRGAVTANGKGEVVLGLGFMLLGENSHGVTDRLALRLKEVEKSLPAGIVVEPLYARTEIVDQVLHTVRTNLLEAALLVVAVLFAFLGSVRAGLIVAVAIPLSMLVASTLMLRLGIAGTLMSLGAIDFGLVVDSAVIQVENAMRKLGHDTSSRSREEIVAEAVTEVRKPTMFGELIIFIVYLPVLLLEGTEGKMFRPMALTMLFALFGSLLLSLTVIPALASWVLPRHAKERDTFLVRVLKAGYAPILVRSLRWPFIPLTLALGLLAGGVYLAPKLGAEFIPRLQEGALVVNTVRLSGVSVEESVRYGSEIEEHLMAKFPDEIKHVWTRTGTAEITTDPMGVELSDVFIALRPREQWKRASTQDELAEEIAGELDGYPGMRALMTQPIEMRVNEMVSGVRSDVGIKLFGDDIEALKANAREIETVVKTIPGASDVVTEQVTGQPILSIDVDRAAIARHGIAAGDVLDVVEALGAIEVGTLQQGDRRFPIAVRLDDRYREDPEAAASVLVTSTSGERIPLSELARVHITESPASVQREWAKRRIVVQANVRGRDVASFVAEAKKAIDDQVHLPAGSYVRFGGQFEHFERAKARLMIVVPIALALIFGLLYVTYGRVRDAARVFLGVPFAAVGGVAALYFRGLPFSVSAAVGFVALFGVSVLGDMVLVSTVRQLEAEGYAPLDAVREAAIQRLRPVLMTALVASLGFVPMALNTGMGAEVQRPLATVVIGGVVTATILTLFVLPALYAVFGRTTKLG
ncbi:MAG: efflux RND transporter permease subunit [Polyangiaceae bacterium]|nr:efflux RND transporter permease subunit [Polyangiaceae bacterium]